MKECTTHHDACACREAKYTSDMAVLKARLTSQVETNQHLLASREDLRSHVATLQSKLDCAVEALKFLHARHPDTLRSDPFAVHEFVGNALAKLNENGIIQKTSAHESIPSQSRLDTYTLTDAREAAEKWVFETNGNKWSNNDDTAGDNFGSFLAGVEWAKSCKAEKASPCSECAWANQNASDRECGKHPRSASAAKVPADELTCVHGVYHRSPCRKCTGSGRADE